MLEVDETGLVISYEEYTPYGASAYQAARSGVDVSARRYRYTGKERDEETGLYYNGARYLAAWLGRWTSADPIGIGADGPGLYNYTRGSPINYTDPSGTEGIEGKPAAKGRDLFSVPPGFETPSPEEKAARREKITERARGAGDVIGQIHDLTMNEFNWDRPDDGAPTIVSSITANMAQKYRDAGGGHLGVRDAINTWNPLVSLYEETKAGFKAAEQGDQRAVGAHQFGALTSLFSFLGLWKGAVGGKPAIGSGSGLATNEGPVLAGVAVAQAESTGVLAGVAVGVALSASSGGGGGETKPPVANPDETPATAATTTPAEVAAAQASWMRKAKLGPGPTADQLFANGAMTVEDFIGKHRRGGIKSVLPDEAKSMTVEQALRKGEVGGVDIRKLLTSTRDKFRR